MTATIAVVDDDVRILDAIAMVLEAEGWTVQTYTTGEAFLIDYPRMDGPRCLILDPHLPGMNGAEIVNTILCDDSRTDFPIANLPIIALTARPSSAIALQIVAAGAHALLTKPIGAGELIDHIQAAISTSSDVE